MGYVKDLENFPDPGTFPDAQFEISGAPPDAQCSEALIQGDSATTTGPFPKELTDVGAFTGHNLAGKVLHITASVGGSTGDFAITGNTNDILELATSPGNGDPVTYYVSNGGALIISQDIQSFADFISAAGYAYTIKGGKLYTNIPSLDLADACKILFAPLT